MNNLKIFTLLIALFSTTFIYAFPTKPVDDTTKINQEFVPDDPIVAMLDSLVNYQYFENSTFTTDISKLNIYNFPPNFIPTYSDSVYFDRIAALNAKSPIGLIYNQDVKTFIDLYAVRKKALTARILGLAQIYFPLFEEQLDRFDMPLELKYLAVIESALIPRAKSKVGASGLWQFMYGTGKMYDLKVSSFVDDRRDPYKATIAACRHMKDLYKTYNDWLLVLAAYNSGAGNVNKAIRRSGGKMDFWQIKPYLPKETQGYVPAFIAVNYVLNYAAEHNIYPVEPAFMHYEIDTVAVKDVVSFDQISEKLGIPIADIEFLNPSYQRGIIPSTKGETYYLRLPQKYVADFINNETALYQYTTSKGIERDKLLSLLKNAPASERTFYKVKNGETLTTISRKLNCSVSDLKRWNHIRKNTVRNGTRLIVYSQVNTSEGLSLNKQPNELETENSGPEKTIYHKVEVGEHLAIIASRYHCSVKDLIVWNDLKETTIQPGQKLIVSGPVPLDKEQKIVKKTTAKEPKQEKSKFVYYTVQAGDTLWGIANKYNGVTVNQIKKINNIDNSNQLKPGQKIKVPLAG